MQGWLAHKGPCLSFWWLMHTLTTVPSFAFLSPWVDQLRLDWAYNASWLCPEFQNGCFYSNRIVGCITFFSLCHILSDSVSFVGNRPLVGEDIRYVSQVSARSTFGLDFPESPLLTSKRPPVGQFKVSEDTAPAVSFWSFLTWCPFPPGVPTHILLNTTGLSPPARADQLELVSVTGKVLKTLPIHYFPERQPQGLWNITEFVPPNEAFFLRVTGYDPNGFVFQRVSSVSFSSIKPGQWWTYWQ